jgi:hypothetical protein
MSTRTIMKHEPRGDGRDGSAAADARVAGQAEPRLRDRLAAGGKLLGNYKNASQVRRTVAPGRTGGERVIDDKSAKDKSAKDKSAKDKSAKTSQRRQVS